MLTEILLQEKNPRFREKGDSDEEDGGDGGKS